MANFAAGLLRWPHMSDEAGSGESGPSDTPRDVLLVGGPTSSGAGAEVLRFREGRVETGELHPIREGQPILGELVQLKTRPEHERIFEVEVLAEGPKAAAPPPRKGPAKVCSDAYRSGWDAIFGAPARDEPN